MPENMHTRALQRSQILVLDAMLGGIFSRGKNYFDYHFEFMIYLLPGQVALKLHKKSGCPSRFETHVLLE